MRVLTFSWDFPPKKNGGLGVACYGLVRALLSRNVEVLFVLPKAQPVVSLPLTRFIFADTTETMSLYPTTSYFGAYTLPSTKVSIMNSKGQLTGFSRSIIDEVHFFAHRASLIAKKESFDVIHAHDWTSYTAGVAAKIASGKPLILHAHATAFDQAAGEHVNPEMYAIENEAFAMADRIIAVSNYTKNIIVSKYNVSPEKVRVIHNGCETEEPFRHPPALKDLKAKGAKIILYHGRITIQKGVDYLVRAARKVVDIEPNAMFIISGWGDMTEQIMRHVAHLGLSRNFIFAGSLWDDERDQMYQSADLVVMPSVSEPFGLVPLESVQHGTPVLISKQSGIAEVLTHALKVDFWDVDDMANKILAALKFGTMHKQLKDEAKRETKKLSWSRAAHEVEKVYTELQSPVH